MFFTQEKNSMIFESKYIIVIYNMVGVAVAIVICTMNEKTCIRTMQEKLKTKFQNSVMHTFSNHNDEIAEAS